MYLLGFSLEALAADEDLVDLDFNEALAMALQLLVLLLALVVEHEDLVATAFADDLGQHLRAAQLLLKLTLFAADSNNVGELERAVFVGALLNPDGIAGGYTVLLTTGANDCVHSLKPHAARRMPRLLFLICSMSCQEALALPVPDFAA